MSIGVLGAGTQIDPRFWTVLYMGGFVYFWVPHFNVTSVTPKKEGIEGVWGNLYQIDQGTLVPREPGYWYSKLTRTPGAKSMMLWFTFSTLQPPPRPYGDDGLVRCGAGTTVVCFHSAPYWCVVPGACRDYCNLCSLLWVGVCPVSPQIPPDKGTVVGGVAHLSMLGSPHPGSSTSPLNVEH